MTARVRPTTLPGAVGENRGRIRGLEFAAPPGLRVTGWTVVFGGGETPVIVGDYQEMWKVPRQIVGSEETPPWYIYDPSASLKVASTSLDVEIMLYRVRTDGTAVTSVDPLLDDPLVIDAGTLDSEISASPVVVAQFVNLEDFAAGPVFDSLMVGIDVAGDAVGLSIDVPIGVEQPDGSGYHIP